MLDRPLLVGIECDANLIADSVTNQAQPMEVALLGPNG